MSAAFPENLLHLSVRHPMGQNIAESLIEIPDVSTKLHAIGWMMLIEDCDASSAFLNDVCAGAWAKTLEEARRKLNAMRRFLDRHAELVTMQHCVLQAAYVSESMDSLVPEATIQWSRRKALREQEQHGGKVVKISTWFKRGEKLTA